ncbi:hypothetical protein JW868_03040 [Candidatus Woesearchaeota archaeon]|nr:hypothetical protein [Candidatus Woesearchaeota archaeon]
MFRSLQVGIVVLLLIVLIPFSSAENDFPRIDFALTDSLQPPKIPVEDGEGVPAEFFQNDTDLLNVTFRFVDRGRPVLDFHLFLIDFTGSKDETTLHYIAESSASMQLSAGMHRLVFIADRLETGGADYFFEANFNLVANDTYEVMFLPCGSIDGNVLTDDGRAVPEAEIEVTCAREYGLQGTYKADEFGTYMIKALPVGKCTLKAQLGDRKGVAKADIILGEIAEVDIILNKDRAVLLWAIVILLSVLILLLVVYIFRKPRAKTLSDQKHAVVAKPRKTSSERARDQAIVNVKTTVEEASSDFPSRLKDVTETLNRREKAIVQALIGKSPQSQNAIVHKTLIPKTSIVRILENLESKKVLTVKKEGKSKKIALTDWIMGKD